MFLGSSLVSSDAKPTASTALGSIQIPRSVTTIKNMIAPSNPSLAVYRR